MPTRRAGSEMYSSVIPRVRNQSLSVRTIDLDASIQSAAVLLIHLAISIKDSLALSHLIRVREVLKAIAQHEVSLRPEATLPQKLSIALLGRGARVVRRRDCLAGCLILALG
jgi:hypothetical protein